MMICQKRKILKLEEKVERIEDKLELEENLETKFRQRPRKGILIKEKLEESTYLNSATKYFRKEVDNK